MSSEANRPIMGLVMNSISGAYLMTRSDTMIDDVLFSELIGMIIRCTRLPTLYTRLMKYGVHPRSGRALFSALLPESFYYNQKGILVMEGILIQGQLKKSHVGTSNRSIIQELWKNYGAKTTSDFFTNATWIINKWLIERGFSVGLHDVINIETTVNGVEVDRSLRFWKRIWQKYMFNWKH